MRRAGAADRLEPRALRARARDRAAHRARHRRERGRAVSPESMRAHVAREVEKGTHSLGAGEQLLLVGLYDDAVTRLCYAAFHFASAALLTEGVEASSHHGLMTLFSEHLVRSGPLPASRAKDLKRLQLFSRGGRLRPRLRLHGRRRRGGGGRGARVLRGGDAPAPVARVWGVSPIASSRGSQRNPAVRRADAREPC